jgi:hypothetical protein
MTIIVTFTPKIYTKRGGYKKGFLQLLNSGRFHSLGSLVDMKGSHPWIDYELKNGQTEQDVRDYFRDYL